MPSNIILECSQYQSNSETNSEWTTTFQEPVMLEDGDVFQLQQALINTQTVSSGSIQIAKDIDITIQVAYYEMALGSYIKNTQNHIHLDRPYQTDSVYDAYKNNPLPFATTKPHGQTSTLQTLYNTTFDLSSGDDLTVFPAGFYLLRKPNADGVTVNDASELVTADVTFTLDAGVYSPDSLASAITSSVERQLDETIGGVSGTNGLTIDISDQKYDPCRMRRVEGDVLGNSDASDRVENYTVKSADNNDQFRTIRMIGASTFTFSFADNVFSFDNMHTPIMGENAANIYANPSVGFMTGDVPNITPENKLRFIDSYGGCVITDLQPRSFWNTLGFTDNHIDNNVKFDDAVYKAFSSVSDSLNYFNSRRVRPDVVVSDYRSPTFPGNFTINPRINWTSTPTTETPIPFTIGSQTATYYVFIPLNNTMVLVASDSTYSLSGDENYVVDDIGYYRLEAETVVSNEFKQNDGRLGSVVGLVSKNYNANDFITGYGSDSGVPYQHTGTAQVISAVKIRVIDPVTGEAVVGLGANSTVFLEIIKAEKKVKK